MTTDQNTDMTTDQNTDETIQPPAFALAPHLVCRGAADAIEFYRQAFGAEELIRMPGPDGAIMHACVSVNGAPVMLVDENLELGLRSPLDLGGSPVTIHVVVDDADAWMERAVAAGGTCHMPVAEQFWGDRYGVYGDPFGHTWSFATPVRTLTSTELADAASAAGT